MTPKDREGDPLLGKDSPEALHITEQSREAEWKHPSFLASLFLGKVDTSLVFPYPQQDPADKAEGDAFLAKLQAFLKQRVDADAVDRDRNLPEEVVRGLAELGCFGMKIPKQYGGLGLSQTNYSRAIEMLGSHCGTTTVYLSAHQSIGAPQPLVLFGSEEQKRRYLPQLAAGRISAFALTEPEVGSDPAAMITTAVPTEDGSAYILNGEKLWCTNAPVADIFVVMAKTPEVVVRGKARTQITAFIVERGMPGFSASYRCDFMGLKGIQNGMIRMENVRVPKENILWGLGKGLKLAFVTLNAGRIAIPAGSVGTAKRCLQIVREWAGKREQWGGPVGKHESVAERIGAMSATTYAMDAMVGLAGAMVDRKTTDIRLEAAMAKLYCSEATWKIVDDALQTRGGRGYETADSLRGRGEEPVPMERLFRDTRINRIIEGTSDIMHLFIAREALDAHMNRLKAMLDPKRGLGGRLAAFFGAGLHYALWYPGLWLRWSAWPRYSGMHPVLAGHMRSVDRSARTLALKLFHGAMKYQVKLADRQLLLGRLVEVGGELFAMTAACSKAQAALDSGGANRDELSVADLFCRQARRNVKRLFAATASNDDRQVYALAQAALQGRLLWLEEGIL